ncbi:hypothetical protein PLESTF_000830700 [Pleodorina starrii]|nr:hypothetical protein PLESTM_000897400 [Pleodorina starrii]GLC69438.1 hypothetical protein PLESTF_000830700 [Pleodorina starrii]
MELEQAQRACENDELLSDLSDDYDVQPVSSSCSEADQESQCSSLLGSDDDEDEEAVAEPEDAEFNVKDGSGCAGDAKGVGGDAAGAARAVAGTAGAAAGVGNRGAAAGAAGGGAGARASGGHRGAALAPLGGGTAADLLQTHPLSSHQRRRFLLKKQICQHVDCNFRTIRQYGPAREAYARVTSGYQYVAPRGRTRQLDCFGLECRCSGRHCGSRNRRREGAVERATASAGCPHWLFAYVPPSQPDVVIMEERAWHRGHDIGPQNRWLRLVPEVVAEIEELAIK